VKTLSRILLRLGIVVAASGMLVIAAVIAINFRALIGPTFDPSTARPVADNWAAPETDPITSVAPKPGELVTDPKILAQLNSPNSGDPRDDVAARPARSPGPLKCADLATSDPYYCGAELESRPKLVTLQEHNDAVTSLEILIATFGIPAIALFALSWVFKPPERE